MTKVGVAERIHQDSTSSLANEKAGRHGYRGADFATQLVDLGAVLVGVDFWNVDDTEDPARPVHTRLRGSNVLIV